MLTITDVSKIFSTSKGKTHALTNVSFSVPENKVLALIGESGSGKSTLAELIIGLQKPSEGCMTWFGDELKEKSINQDIQYIFQNPDRSLNPYWKIKDILLEPLLLNKIRKKDAIKKVIEMIELVELPKDILSRYPKECSGGQKQRIAIARSLTLKPKLLIADEITSALDPRTEEAVIDLLNSIKKQINLSILYITHRIHTVDQLADEVVVLKDGKVIEAGPVNSILHSPTELYTQRLIDACHYGNYVSTFYDAKEAIS